MLFQNCGGDPLGLLYARLKPRNFIIKITNSKSQAPNRFKAQNINDQNIRLYVIASPSLIVIRSSSLCHSEGAKRPKNLAQGKLREAILLPIPH